MLVSAHMLTHTTQEWTRESLQSPTVLPPRVSRREYPSSKVVFSVEGFQ